jgi:phage-related protein
MDSESCVIYSGEKFILEWYYDKNGNSVAYEYFLNMTRKQRRRFFALAKKMGDIGKILDITKFRNEGDGIYAFKPQPDRYLSFFTDNKKIIITNGYKKKTEKLPNSEKKLAIKYRKEYFERKTRGRKKWKRHLTNILPVTLKESKNSIKNIMTFFYRNLYWKKWNQKIFL